MTTFDNFWWAYPRKVGRKPAKAVWDKLTLYGVKPEAIMAGLRRYMADKPDWQAWCHPVTFLRQERFSDYEPVEAPGQHQDARRLVEGCEVPPDLPSGAVPLSRTLQEVLWLLPDGSRVARPRFQKRERPAAGGEPGA